MHSVTEFRGILSTILVHWRYRYEAAVSVLRLCPSCLPPCTVVKMVSKCWHRFASRLFSVMPTCGGKG